MNVEEEIESLRRRLGELADGGEPEWMRRYALESPRRPPGFYWQLRWLAGRTLRWLEHMGLRRPDPWPASLKQSETGPKAKALLIWAVGADAETLRESCGILFRRKALGAFAPVLVTDVTDFAFFSRLGWLVEYVPRLAGEGDPYEERKLEFLACLYRGAPALPVTAALVWQADDIRQWLAHRA